MSADHTAEPQPVKSDLLASVHLKQHAQSDSPCLFLTDSSKTEYKHRTHLMYIWRTVRSKLPHLTKREVDFICRLSPPYLSCHSLEWRGEDSRWSHRRSLYRREQSCWWASSQRPITEIADERYNDIKCMFRQVRRRCTPLLVSCTYTSSSSELLSEVMSYCTPPIIKSVVQHESWESERSGGIQLYLQFPTQYALQTCIRAFRLHTAQQVSQESLISFHMT